MASPKKILPLIKEKPARFFKKLMKYHRREDLLSGLVPSLYREGEQAWAELLETYKSNPREGAYLGNIFSTLLEYYDYAEFDYGQNDYMEVAKYIKKNYQARIDRYMKKKYEAGELGVLDKPYHDSHTAFREQVARGFILDGNYKNRIKDQFYIKSTLSTDLVYPELFDSSDKAFKAAEKLSVAGYTGVSQPKHSK